MVPGPAQDRSGCVRTLLGQGARRQVPDRSKLRFALTTQKQAEAFKAQFGGVLHEVLQPDR